LSAQSTLSFACVTGLLKRRHISAFRVQFAAPPGSAIKKYRTAMLADGLKIAEPRY
jgi:hypothetical protein